MSGLTWYLRMSITSGMDALRSSGPVVLRAAKRAAQAHAARARPRRGAEVGAIVDGFGQALRPGDCGFRVLGLGL